LASQLAALASSPDYAQATGLNAGISIAQLRGLVLFCGPHDRRIMATQAPSSWFLRTVMWSYFGSKAPPEATVQAFSVVPHVSSSFPPAFITVGNGAPLASQSIALADALRLHGVRVETLFYPASHKPSLPHEYQFNLSLPESREALSRTRAFLHDLTRPVNGSQQEL
jgi:acetyl esterase/lipase